ncbi:hypothetical protein [Candidatus Nitrotoga sp. M5]|uniref:hypothetical protein n=1 Tax=Candidatus Nitrotoga sp. M5 TaxID=2890409 RepID=UPI001EF5AA3D|nr:hypothetical protein [Candidatus Nitrotoga sp. M5]CAH1387230.1 hypothetical protein NTGM5_560020 [Candidatus Nitrotoga sp. M5]
MQAITLTSQSQGINRAANACVADNGYRNRDERDADQYMHAAKPDPLWNKTKEAKKSKCCRFTDFHLTK